MRWLRRVMFIGIPGVLVIAVLLFGGWWFLIRDDAKPATSAPDIPAELAAASPTATSPAAGSASPPTSGTTATSTTPDQKYTIIANQSSASYYVGEKLASLSLPSTAKGTTSISGQFGFDNTTVPAGTSFSVDLTQLKSDQARRDQRVQAALDTSQYPTATFVAEKLTGAPATIIEGTEYPLQIAGKFTLHGVQREVTWNVKAKKQGQAISALATLKINFSDYGITKPDIAGFVSVDDTATIQAEIVAQAA